MGLLHRRQVLTGLAGMAALTVAPMARAAAPLDVVATTGMIADAAHAPWAGPA